MSPKTPIPPPIPLSSVPYDEDDDDVNPCEEPPREVTREEFVALFGDPDAYLYGDAETLRIILRAERAARARDEQREKRFAPSNRLGKVGKVTQYIRNLVQENRDLAHKPKTLRKRADSNELGNMSAETFRNRVAEARKFHGIP